MASSPTINPPQTPIAGNLMVAPEWWRYFYQIQRVAVEFTAGTITTAPGSGLQGGGNVATGLSLSIAPNGVSNAMLRQGLSTSVIGRAFGTAGNVADIQAVTDNTVLGRFSGQLMFMPLSSVPATVGDGNYGDITISGGGSVWTINNAVVSFAKLQNISSDRLVGRDSAGSGSATEISVTGGIEFTGSNAIQVSAFTGDAAKAAGGTVLTLATVNSNVGTFGSATQVGQLTVNSKGLITAASNVTLTPAASSIIGGQALTRTDDANVTLTLGGTPSTALLQSVSVTAGWTGTLAVARGGTGGGTPSGTLLDNITGFASTGIVARTGAGAYAFRTITGTANEITVANGNGASGNPVLSLPTALTFTGKTVTGGTYTGASSYSAGSTYNQPGAFRINADSNWSFGMFSDLATIFKLRLSYGGDTTNNRGVSFYDTSSGAEVALINENGIAVAGEVRGNSLRIDQTPTAETPIATHTITISANGTNYKLLCVAA